MGVVVDPVGRAHHRNSNSALAGNPWNRFIKEAVRDSQEYGGWAASLGKVGRLVKRLLWTLSNRRMLPPDTSTSLSKKAARSSARSKPRRQRRRGTRALRRPGGLRASLHERCPRSAASPARQRTTERLRALVSRLLQAARKLRESVSNGALSGVALYFRRRLPPEVLQRIIELTDPWNDVCDAF